ncbi:MAG: hypothetical protein JST93_06760 [Acidobacteria bacterium]|nr:hypothetical protein [Acidobacteriota bacterium]
MTDSRMTWQNPRILSILLLVFVCGAMAGAVTMRLGFSQSFRRPQSYWKEGGKEISLDRFRRELSLNDEQTRQMESALNDFVMYYQSLQEQMNDVRAQGKFRITQILNEEQRQKFNRMMSDLQTKQIK